MNQSEHFEQMEAMAIQSQDLAIATGLVPRRAAGIRRGIGLWLDRQTAEHYYDGAGGDPDAARLMAAKDGWRFCIADILASDSYPDVLTVTERDRS